MTKQMFKMKKMVLCLMAVALIGNAMAQKDYDVAMDGLLLNRLNRAAGKSDVHYRMTAFSTSDNYQFNFYGYDGQGRLVAVKDTVSNDYCVIDSLFYDGQGRMTRLSGWQLLDGVLKNVYYIDYAYDERGNIVSRTNYNNFGDNWELGGVYTYTYNSDNNIVLTELTMGGMSLQKVEYGYEGGLLSEELWYSFNGNGLVPSEKLNYEYDGGRLARVHDSSTVDGVHYEYYALMDYSYDEYGNCVEYVYYDVTGGVRDRSEYSFDYSMPLSEVTIPWNPEMVRPKVYDNVHAYDREAWYSVDVDHVLHYVCDFIYSYESATAGIAEMEVNVLKASPNPASGNVLIEGLASGDARVRVVDALGRQVMTGVLADGNNTLDVSGLANGCYVVSVWQNGGCKSFKLLVEK